jgi:membrane protein
MPFHRLASALLARLASARALAARRLSGTREVVRFSAQRARSLHLPQVAANLTFSSVLSLVPLLAVALAVLTAFPVFSEFRANMERDLPGGLLPLPYARTILRYLTEFTSKAAGVGAAGLLFLGLSAVSMVLTVDRVLNEIWYVRRRRPLIQRLLVYWAVLSIGPLLLGVSLTLTSYVVSLSETHPDRVARLVNHAMSLASPVIAAMAYAAVYALVPNRRVRWRDALAGGAVTAILGELMSRGLAAYVMHGSLWTVYGAFAAVPVFLIWIFLSWLTFLFGATLTASLPQFRGTRLADSQRVGNSAVTALALLRLLLTARSGAVPQPVALEAMARRLRTDEEELGALLLVLERLGYVRRLAPAESRLGEEWILTCDPTITGVRALLHTLLIDPDLSLLRRQDLDLREWVGTLVDGEWLRRGLEPDGRPNS